jgi:hypothetical protein
MYTPLVFTYQDMAEKSADFMVKTKKNNNNNNNYNCLYRRGTLQ